LRGELDTHGLRELLGRALLSSPLMHHPSPPISLLESMILTDHRKIERVTRGLIPLAKVIPHLINSSKGHELRSKLWQNTSSENNRSTSNHITPLSISSLSITKSRESLREILYLLIISIDCSIIGGLGDNPTSLRSISSNN
jgi:hypothetical protein